MTIADECRLLIDAAPNSGAWNMAVDAALLASAVAGAGPTVRIYRWREPTVSLGYFQSADSLRDSPLKELPTVRRLSGGGAILHDDEITYSCALPAGHPLAAAPSELYRRVSQAVVEILNSLGASAKRRGAALDAASEPFLCFGRGDPNDVVFQGQKIMGSAQRRRRGAVLQHGALLLRRSPLTPEHAGLHDLNEMTATDDELGSMVGRAIASLLADRVIPGVLTPEEAASVRQQL